MSFDISQISQSFKSHPIYSTLTVIGAFVFSLFIGSILNAAFGLAIITYPLAFVCVVFASQKVEFLSWFWGTEAKFETRPEKVFIVEPEKEKPSSENTPETLELEAVDKPRFGVALREFPMGANLIHLDDKSAKIELQVAIRFWCWILPLALGFLVIPAAILGAGVGYSSFIDGYEHNVSHPGQIVSYMSWGAIICSGLAGGLSYLAYRETRPTITINIDHDQLVIGSYLFDRRFVNGITLGYQNDSSQLRGRFLEPESGVTSLNVAFGRWGENTKYLVRSDDASAIIVWINEIMESVGPIQERANNAGIGQKIELL